VNGVAGTAVTVPNLYTADGTLSGNRTVAAGASTLTFSSSATNGFSVGGTTFSVDAANNRVGIGTAAPGSKLEVNGAATNTTAYNAGSSTTIDFTQSNLAYTTASAGAFTLSGLKDGGTYTLAVQGTTSGTATFTQSGMTFKSTNNIATTSGYQTVYTFIVMGTTVYYWMNSGF
jgi:hypothetical protein